MSKSKVVIVGASHGGHESAIELLDRYSEVDVTIYEAGDFVSFMSCGMELYLTDKVTAKDDVRNFAPADLEKRGGKVVNNHQVTAINADRKTVTVKDLKLDQDKEVAYDKLILSSGVKPTTLPVPGAELENIYLMRGYDWASKIKDALESDVIQDVVVVGAGYIGLEAVAAFASKGKKVTLVDVIDRPLGTYLNPELIDVLEPELERNGVRLHMGAKVESFQGNNKIESLKTDKGDIKADLVIIAAGVKPNTDWLQGTLELESGGFIKIDEYFRTSLADVYAIGDAVLPLSIPAGKPLPIALATTARREAQYLVKHLFETKPSQAFQGVVGSSALSIFDYQFATSGLNAFSAKKAGLSRYQTSIYEDRLRPAYIPETDNPKVYVSLTFDPLTYQILGGAVLSKYDITAQGNILSLAIAHKMTLEDLAQADFFFQPRFDRQWSLLNLAAQHALNLAAF
ncbi:FAD-dependent oxidoreductase [Streptococcus dentapri]|uniref:FAD-dependent oxidoreductase n=1 Tax=Streptococcus dentapri TaxID=573564 RepID=A0ABV8D029_9STRE